MQNLIQFIVASPIILVAISFIVFIHELGHFLAAKKSGVWVEEFGLGLPPRIFGKKIGETLYSINALPIGGFVRLHGEALDEKVKNKEKSFSHKPKLVRIFIALAGIFMNFLLAIVCFSIVFSFVGVERDTQTVSILDVASDSPAQTAGILTGDVVKQINGVDVIDDDQFIELINQNAGKRTTLVIERTLNENRESKIIQVTPRENPPEGQGAIGISFTNKEIYFPPVWQRPFIGAYTGIVKTMEFSREVVFGFGKLSSDVSQGRSPEGVVGIVGISAVLYEASQQGIFSLIFLIGGISLNLAIFNLIPFPPLDGSRVMFVVAEKFFGRKKLPRIENYAHTIGMAILLLLFVVITGKELGKLLGAGSIEEFVQSLVPQK